MVGVVDLNLEHAAPIPTWFKVGGRADAMARPGSIEELRAALEAHAGQAVRVLGDGANLLVGDEGVDGLVVDLKRLDRAEVVEDRGADVLVRAQGGAKLPKLIVETVRDGLAGLETLAGIPASLGGAAVMNAGGAFGQLSDVVEFVDVLAPDGSARRIDAGDVRFAYRRSALSGLIVTAVGLRLRRVEGGERAALRERLKEVMAYKKRTQPMGENSAGCFFKNPTVNGERVSAGMLIDRAGCKGLAVGAASVSHQHANFLTTGDGCTACDLLALAEEVRRRVAQHAGIVLENEVVIWRRGVGGAEQRSGARSGP